MKVWENSIRMRRVFSIFSINFFLKSIKFAVIINYDILILSFMITNFNRYKNLTEFYLFIIIYFSCRMAVKSYLFLSSNVPTVFSFQLALKFAIHIHVHLCYVMKRTYFAFKHLRSICN